MDLLERYPLNLEDESDSDSETFNAADWQSIQDKVHVKCPSTDIPNIASCSVQKYGQSSKDKPKSKAGEEDVMEKSILKPGFEQLESVPKGGSRAMQKRKARQERAKTTGAGWFNMKAPEMTDEMRQNLEVLQMRGAIDKNRVYKKNDMRTLPKYFATGTVVEHAADFYSSRIPKKQRKKTLVEELMADAEAKKQLKKKAAKLAIKKQIKAQNRFPRKKKQGKKRSRDMD